MGGGNLCSINPLWSTQFLKREINSEKHFSSQVEQKIIRFYNKLHMLVSWYSGLR